MWTDQTVVLRVSTVILSVIHRLELANDLLERLDLLLHLAAALHHILDGCNRMHRRAVIAIELLPDVVEGEVEQLTAEVDGNLPWVDDVPRALGADEVAVLHLEEALDLLLDVLNGEILRSSAGKMVFKQRADIGDGEVGLIEERHLVNHLGDGAFQLSYVGARVFRYVHLNILGDDEVLSPFGVAVLVDEAFDDAELRLDLGRLDVDGSALVEPRMVALVDVDVFRRSVGRENDLLPLAGELVEDLEHDVERLLLALEVLDVVDEEDVGFLVMGFEVPVARLFLIVRCACVHVVGQKLGRVDVDRSEVRLRLADVVLYGPHEVRFPQPALSVDEQRVKRRLSRHLGDVDRHGVGHAVGVADDEVLERERGGGVIARSRACVAPRAVSRGLLGGRASIDVVVEGGVAHTVGVLETRRAAAAFFDIVRDCSR